MLTQLKFERLKLGMRQWELANKVGIDGSRLSLIESGRLLPTEDVKEAICRVINKPVNALFPTTSFGNEVVVGRRCKGSR